ncbi:MAG: hypothetical protein RLQ73_24205 [Hoeflea sp. D1-CHI-28]
MTCFEWGSSTDGRLVGCKNQNYDPHMKIVLYVFAVLTGVGPIAGWAYLVGLASAYNTGSHSRGISLADYWDTEFLMLAAVPWLLSAVSLFFASRMQ